jgi:hypothetical protein
VRQVLRPLFLLAVVAALALPAGLAGAAPARAPGQPAPGKVLLGVIGDPAAFDRLTGRRHPLRVLFGAFRGDVAATLERERADRRLPVLTLETRMKMGGLARGGEDAWLVRLAQQVNEFGDVVWIRPFAEMNGHWNPWCAFDKAGRPRGGPDATTGAFRNGFRRVAIIMKGGSLAAIDGRLRQAGLPPLRVRPPQGIARSGKVAILWNPQGEGSPNVRGNQPEDYWPGPQYVDYVGNDLYAIRGRAVWRGMDALYNRYQKPFVLAEWAPWGYDDPEFARQVFAWVAARPRTAAIVYFDRGWSGGVGTFQLSTKPKTLAVYRQAVKHPRFSTP